jgi:hypothetical protein
MSSILAIDRTHHIANFITGPRAVGTQRDAARFFARLLRAAQTDWNVERPRAALDVLGQGGVGQRAAGRTAAAMAPIFGDVRVQLRQFPDLTASWLADASRPVQRALALATHRWHEIDNPPALSASPAGKTLRRGGLDAVVELLTGVGRSHVRRIGRIRLILMT